MGVLDRTPLFSNLKRAAPLGMIFIDLTTRRRLRINGTVTALDDVAMQVAVDEAFPNCPKYIQRREIVEVNQEPLVTTIEQGVGLDETRTEWIRNADTLFVASSHPDGRIDASHRGGDPGFVRCSDDALLIPDYAGNSMFNTFGNFALDSRAGVTFLDFERGQQLQLTGEAEIRFDVESDRELTGGTGRWWAFRPRRWITSPWNQTLAWRFLDASRFNPRSS
jgi:hypothetical protein